MKDADTRRLQSTDEARAVRESRDQLALQPADPLRERQRLMAFWRNCARTNKAYEPHNGAWWSSFVVGGRHLLMPRLRAMLDARDRVWRAREEADRRAWSERCRHEKALRQAKPLPLFSTEDV